MLDKYSIYMDALGNGSSTSHCAAPTRVAGRPAQPSFNANLKKEMS